MFSWETFFWRERFSLASLLGGWKWRLFTNLWDSSYFGCVLPILPLVNNSQERPAKRLQCVTMLPCYVQRDWSIAFASLTLEVVAQWNCWWGSCIYLGGLLVTKNKVGYFELSKTCWIEILVSIQHPHSLGDPCVAVKQVVLTPQIVWMGLSDDSNTTHSWQEGNQWTLRTSNTFESYVIGWGLLFRQLFYIDSISSLLEVIAGPMQDKPFLYFSPHFLFLLNSYFPASFFIIFASCLHSALTQLFIQMNRVQITSKIWDIC